MRGWLSIAALAAALLTTSALAQMRGAHGGFSGARPAIVARAPSPRFTPRVAPGFAGNLHTRPAWSFRGPFSNGNFGFVNGNSAFRGHFHHHHPRNGFFFNSPHNGFFFNFGFPYRGYYGYGYYPGYYYPYYSYYPYEYDSSADVSSQQNDQLQQQVSQLSNQISVLQAQQEEQAEAHSAAASTPPPPQPQQESQSNQPSVPTTLVFRDGKTEQVRNYAVAGKTLWIFNEQRARRIPLSELDIPATKNINEDRGVTFQLP
jgi:hypothetical protein